MFIFIYKYSPFVFPAFFQFQYCYYKYDYFKIKIKYVTTLKLHALKKKKTLTPKDTKLPCVWCVCNLCRWSTLRGQLDTPPPDTQIPQGEMSGLHILVSLVASLQSQCEQTLHYAWNLNL